MRWLSVAAAALLLGSAPLVPRVLPVDSTDISATALVERIQHSERIGWSGEVRALGSLNVPLTGSTFGGVARVLGEKTDLRVWWRDAESWRLDRIRATGESDLIRDGGLMVRWNYEDNRARFTPYSPVRLPDDVDVVPSSLAVRLLSGARPTELFRLAARRIAGRNASGVRLLPADARSTISRVDVWADDTSGLPLRVDVYGAPAGGTPILSTRVTAVDLGKPTKDRVGFQPSPSLRVSRGVALDEAAGSNAFAPFIPPDTLDGLPRRGRPETFGAVGVYGRGPTAVLAVPLRRSTTEALRRQLMRSQDAREEGRTIAMEVGPVSLLLADRREANFLLAGTVTPATLKRAAVDLVQHVRRTP